MPGAKIVLDNWLQVYNFIGRLALSVNILPQSAYGK